MAYTPVPTVTTGDIWTASNHNTYIRDNFAAGVPDLFTSKGDLAVGTGPNAAIRLGLGTSGSVLTADPTQPGGIRWGRISAAAKVSRASLAVNASELKTVDFNVEDLDPLGMVNLTTQPQRITIPSGLSGWYTIEIYVVWENTSVTKMAYVYKNGAVLYPDEVAAELKIQSAPYFTYLEAGDYLTLVLSHTGSGAITISKAEMSVVSVLV